MNTRQQIYKKFIEKNCSPTLNTSIFSRSLREMLDKTASIYSRAASVIVGQEIPREDEFLDLTLSINGKKEECIVSLNKAYNVAQTRDENTVVPVTVINRQVTTTGSEGYWYTFSDADPFPIYGESWDLLAPKERGNNSEGQDVSLAIQSEEGIIPLKELMYEPATGQLLGQFDRCDNMSEDEFVSFYSTSDGWCTAYPIMDSLHDVNIYPWKIFINWQTVSIEDDLDDSESGLWGNFDNHCDEMETGIIIGNNDITSSVAASTLDDIAEAIADDLQITAISSAALSAVPGSENFSEFSSKLSGYINSAIVGTLRSGASNHLAAIYAKASEILANRGSLSDLIPSLYVTSVTDAKGPTDDSPHWAGITSDVDSLYKEGIPISIALTYAMNGIHNILDATMLAMEGCIYLLNLLGEGLIWVAKTIWTGANAASRWTIKTSTNPFVYDLISLCDDDWDDPSFRRGIMRGHSSQLPTSNNVNVTRINKITAFLKKAGCTSSNGVRVAIPTIGATYYLGLDSTGIVIDMKKHIYCHGARDLYNIVTGTGNEWNDVLKNANLSLDLADCNPEWDFDYNVNDKTFIDNLVLSEKLIPLGLMLFYAPSISNRYYQDVTNPSGTINKFVSYHFDDPDESDVSVYNNWISSIHGELNVEQLTFITAAFETFIDDEWNTFVTVKDGYLAGKYNVPSNEEVMEKWLQSWTPIVTVVGLAAIIFVAFKAVKAMSALKLTAATSYAKFLSSASTSPEEAKIAWKKFRIASILSGGISSVIPTTTIPSMLSLSGGSNGDNSDVLQAIDESNKKMDDVINLITGE